MGKPTVEKVNFVIEETASGTRFDVLLSQKAGISRAHAQELIALGRIQINGKTVTKPSHKMHSNDCVAGTLDEANALSLDPIAGKLDILFEDDSLIVLNKPQGLIVHPAPSCKKPTLVHFLLHHLKNSAEFIETSPIRPGIVHRLDRGTSGVLLVAKNRKAHEVLSREFKSRTIKKEYEAIVWGTPPDQGRMESSIGRDRKDRKRFSSHTHEGRLAITDFICHFKSLHFSHVGLFPFTGRTHQLRVQLFEAGCPILGDELYRHKTQSQQLDTLSPVVSTAIDGLTDTLLHAKRISFIHPTSGEALSIEAQRPAVFDKLLMLLRNFDT